MKFVRKLALAGALAAAIGAPAHAQLIVYDPNNFGQNVLTAARALQQIDNQIKSLANQATSLVNQARNLTNLPYSSLGTLLSSVQRTEQLLNQTQRIGYSVAAVDQAFQSVYPQSYAGASNPQLTADALARWQNARASYQDAMHVQASAVQNLDATRTQITALVGTSQSAVGALQAAQSGNQLLALQTTQLTDLTAVLSAMARAQSLDASRIAESQAQAQQQLNLFLNGGRGYQSQAVAMFQ